MKGIRELYGDTTIDKTDYNELDAEYKMELKYFKIQDKSKRDKRNTLSNNSYGIEVCKKEIKNGRVDMEDKSFLEITNCEEKVDMILDILKRNKVTPVSVPDVLEDLNYKFI